MKTAKPVLIIIMSILLTFLMTFCIGCSQNEQDEGEAGEHASSEAGEHASRESGEHEGERSERSEEEGEHSSRERGEHGGEGHGEEGEESGTRYTLDDTCDEIRKGVTLVLKYDKASSSFIGTVNNLSSETVRRVRVEVHLSNKTELGPTKSVDLAPGKQADVKLSAEGQSFEWWSAHAESGSSEH